jgi:hypothetical protein
MKTSDSLTLFSTYSRKYLQELFNITDFSINNGIFHPKDNSSIWIFVTRDKTNDRTNYKDDFDGQTLNFEGQLKGRTDKKIINHSSEGNEILLFYRERKDEYPNYAFKYFGRFQYISSSGSNPRRFTLQSIDIVLKDVMEPYLNEAPGTTQIKTQDGSVRDLKRRLTVLKVINPMKTENNFIAREEQTITYQRNDKAQEEANELHKITLDILEKYFRINNIIPRESVIDLLVEKQNKVFIFEVKSIHAENFRDQTRYAIGQLLEYEYFEIKNKSQFKNKEIYKGVLYSEEPPNEFIDFMEACNLGVYWISDNSITGANESMRRLKDFVQ